MVTRLFAIDFRSLALFRIAIGIVLLVDLAIRATDLNAMYTDDGAFSRALICQHYTSIWNWSFHFASGSLWFQAALFGLSAMLAIAFMLGYQTRLATIASWLMLISLHNRVPPILNGADNLMRMLLFWAIFLPLDRVWSVSARQAKHRDTQCTDDNAVVSVASAAILLQMALMYLFSAIFKSNDDWLHGEAIAGALSHGFFARPSVCWLLQFPVFLRIATFGTLILECLGPVLLFVPWYTARIRVGVIALLAVMHLGIVATLSVGLFSYVCLAGLTLFLPLEFWTKLQERFRRDTVASAQRQCEWHVSKPQRSAVSLALSALVALSLGYVLLVNISGLSGRSLPGAPSALHDFLTLSCGFGQRWDMFAETPSRDGWYVARATLVDGSQVDLLRDGRTVQWNRPSNPVAIYSNHRWAKCFREMAYADVIGYQVFREPIAQYLCRNWNRHHGPNRQITDSTLVFCEEAPTDAGLSLSPPILREAFVHLHFDQQPGR